MLAQTSRAATTGETAAKPFCRSEPVSGRIKVASSSGATAATAVETRSACEKGLTPSVPTVETRAAETAGLCGSAEASPEPATKPAA